MPTLVSKPPPIVVVKRPGLYLSPVSGLDAEMLDDYQNGDLFALQPNPRRSGPLHRTYWEALTRVTKATHIQPTKEKLHNALLWSLKYVHVETDTRGIPHLVRDSTAWDQMTTDAEFKPYFNDAMAELAASTGIDPLEFLSDEKPDRA